MPQPGCGSGPGHSSTPGYTTGTGHSARKYADSLGLKLDRIADVLGDETVRVAGWLLGNRGK